MRSEQRRQRREQEAFEMQQINSADHAWQQMEPVIDQALERLGQRDRDAVLLRYVQGHSLRDVGSVLGMTEEAAKKRVSRAIEKLRSLLARRGISVSTAIIGSTLSTNANVAVSETVLTTITSAAGATMPVGPAAAMASEAIAAWRWTRIKWTAGVATVVLVATLVTIGIVHSVFLVRVGRARWAAARQRAVELESYRAIRSGSSVPRA